MEDKEIKITIEEAFEELFKKVFRDNRKMQGFNKIIGMEVEITEGHPGHKKTGQEFEDLPVQVVEIKAYVIPEKDYSKWEKANKGE